MLEPINKPERITSQRKFYGVYFLSLLIPVIATYFWTRSTSDKLKGENAQYQKLFTLLGRVDTLGNEMKKLYNVDKEFNSNIELTEFNATSKSVIRQSEDLIAQMMIKVKMDSTSLLAGMEGRNKRVATGIINNFNIYYDYWITMKSRGSALKGKGIDMSELEKLKQELQLCQMAEKSADNQVKMAIATAAAASKGGGGGSGGAEKYMLENFELKAKIKELEKKIKELEGKPTSTPNVIVTNNADVNLLEAKRLFAEADCDKKRADEGRKRKSKKDIEGLYDDSYKKFKDLLDKTTNGELKATILRRMEQIRQNLKNIPPED